MERELLKKKNYHILIVEDDAIIARTIEFYLKECGIYSISKATTAGEALSEIRFKPDLILMDIMLPDVSGIDLCSEIRKFTYCPIIFISAIDDDNTIIKALETGGDDYLVKPFNNRILNARIQSNLRRVERENDKEKNTRTQLLCFNDFQIDPISHSVITKAKTNSLAPMEYTMLMTLIRHADEIITSEELYQEVWNRPSFGDLRTIPVHIFNLRKKIGEIEDSPRYIKTIRGIGYLFVSNPK